MEQGMTDVRDLADKNYVRVQYPNALRICVDEAHTAARDFWELPQEVKDSLGYQSDTIVSGVGYQGPEKGRDPKEHVHIRLNESEWLRTQCARINNPVVTRFIDKSLILAEAMKPFGRDFVQDLDDEFGIPGLVEDTMSAADRWTFRFLHYLEGQEPGAILAAEHPDKGPFTAHLQETDSGFEMLTADNDWKLIEFGGDETMIIAGVGLQYRSQCKLKAVVHQVRANERTAREGRDAIVCFFEVDNTPHYNKQDNGPTQDHARDFRDMTFDEFKKYFYDR